MKETGKKIAVLGTGGTIAGMAASAADNVGYTAAQVGVAQLLAAVPELAAQPLVCEQVAQLDSKDMDFATWTRLALRVVHWLEQDDVQGVVITHGTDTLEETAYFLQALLDPAKPVVLACAMRPATALSPDGPVNLRDAIAVARHPGARGVVAAVAGKVHGAFDVQKVHTLRLDAFDSGDAGPIGYVEQGALRQLRDWPRGQGAGAVPRLHAIGHRDPTAWPRVEIVLSHAGAGGAVVEALVARGIDGIVAACTGNGTLHHVLEAALLKAQAAGVKVVRATRCAQGRVIGKPGDAIADSQGLTPVKARVAMLLALMA